MTATARVRGMTVVTCNVKDCALAGVQMLNPFAGQHVRSAKRCRLACELPSGLRPLDIPLRSHGKR